MSWKQLVDFDGVINNHKMTVRVTKSDDSVKPKYSVAIGTRNDPNPFRPFLRGDLLTMTSNNNDEPGRTGVSILYSLLLSAQTAIQRDMRIHNEKLEADEKERLAALSGKRQGDPKANTGLSRFKKKHGNQPQD